MYKTETGEPLEFLWDIDKANYFWQENFYWERFSDGTLVPLK